MAERESAAVTCKISSKIKFISYNDLKFGTIWHFLCKKQSSPFWGIFGDFSLFMGKKWGCILIANEPSSRPGVKPSSLIIRRHKNIAHFYLFSTQMGNFRGRKIHQKMNYVSIRIVSESTSFRKLMDSALFLNRYKERYYATGLSGGICGRKSEEQINSCLSISDGDSGMDTLSRKQTKSFRDSGSDSQVSRTWWQIQLPLIS